MFNIFKKKNIEEMKSSVCMELEKLVIEGVRMYSKDKGEICFVALEYFYDGVAIDIGLRIGLQEERTKLEEEYGVEEDVREEGGEFSYYQPLMVYQSIKDITVSLFKKLRDISNEETDYMYITILEFADILTHKLKDVDWSSNAIITQDFTVLGPYEYD